jgi:hypothetical protein
MADKNILKTITLDIEGKEIKLTPDQAKKLHEALAELFAPKEKTVGVPYPIYYPYRIWWQDNNPWWGSVSVSSFGPLTTNPTYSITAQGNSELQITI